MIEAFRCRCGSEACSTEFDPARGRVRVCIQCGERSTPDADDLQPRIGFSPADARNQQEHDAALPDMRGFRLTSPEPKQRKVVATHARQDKPINVVKLARARLREVQRGIKQLRKLEKERDELERLIRAADGKPVAVVANLRTAKGA